MTKQLTAFVIMPFEREFNSIYEELIKAPLVEAGYDVSRADSFVDQENILRAIVRGITTADLLVADLTTNNPNVFYELGLAHGLQIPTVLIAQSISDVPFDLRSYSIHIYDTHFNRIDKLKGFLKKLAQQHKKKEISFGNPVVDFSDIKQITAPVGETSIPEVSSSDAADAAQKELMDFIVDGEQATNDLTAILAKLLEDNQLITERINRHSSTVAALTKDGTAGSARKYHKVFLLAASDINNFSGKVEEQVPRFENAIDRLNENYFGFIQLADTSTTETREALVNLRSQIKNLSGVAKEAKGGTQSFRQASIGLAERKMSKDLSRASRRQADALGGVIANIDRVEAFCVRALAMIDQKLNPSSHYT